MDGVEIPLSVVYGVLCTGSIEVLPEYPLDSISIVWRSKVRSGQVVGELTP